MTFIKGLCHAAAVRQRHGVPTLRRRRQQVVLAPARCTVTVAVAGSMIVISGVVIFVLLIESVGVPHGSLPRSAIFWASKLDNPLRPYFTAYPYPVQF